MSEKDLRLWVSRVAKVNIFFNAVCLIVILCFILYGFLNTQVISSSQGFFFVFFLFPPVNAALMAADIYLVKRSRSAPLKQLQTALIVIGVVYVALSMLGCGTVWCSMLPALFLVISAMVVKPSAHEKHH